MKLKSVRKGKPLRRLRIKLDENESMIQTIFETFGPKLSFSDIVRHFIGNLSEGEFKNTISKMVRKGILKSIPNTRSISHWQLIAD